MLALIRFELKQSRFIVGMVILMIGICSFYLIKQNEFNDISKQITVMNYIEKQNNEDIKKWAKNIETAISKNDSGLYLNNKIKLDKYFLNNNLDSNLDFGESKYYYQNRITFNQYLLDHDIKSLNMIDSTYSNLEEINGISALYNTMAKIISIIMPLCVLISAYKVFYINPDSYNYLMALPYKKKEILISKLFTVAILNFIILLVGIICSFMIGTLIGGIGDINYPIIINYLNINSVSQTYISCLLALFLMVIFSVLKIFVYTVVGMFLSNIFKNKWVTLLVSIIIAVIPVIYLFALDYTYYSNLIPFVFDSAHVIVTYGFSLINIVSYLLVMAIVIYFALLISNSQFDKREG